MIMPQWSGLCGGSNEPLTPSVAALVDSGATHSFVGQKLVEEHQLLVAKDDGMKVTLADGSLVSSSTTCQVHLVACTNRG